MAAGDLDNIVLVAPDSTLTSKLVRNIYWRDHNGVNRSVKYVYWCPDGQSARLVWQRDHSPSVTEYTNLLNSYGNWIMFKWTATQTYIDTIKLWCLDAANVYGDMYGRVYVYNADGSFHSALTSDLSCADLSETTETLNVDGQDQTVHVYQQSNISSHGLNNFVVGNEYYIFINNIYNTPLFSPIFYKNEAGTYWQETDSNKLWMLGVASYHAHICNYFLTDGVKKPKIEVNGAQI